MSGYGDAEWSQIAPLVELKQAIGTRIQRPDAISTGLVGAVTAIPGVGGGLRWAYGKDRETAQGAPSQYDYLPTNYNELDYARAAHPTAFAVGRGAGNLGMMLAGGSALRGSGALSTLSPLGQSVATGGIMTGAAGANDALTDGAPMEQVLEQGVIGAFGGMAGGAASYGVGQVGNAALTSDAAKNAFGKGVKDSVIANAINHGVSGAAFTGANMGTKAILDPDYNPTVDEFLTDMGVSFVFGTVSSAIAMKARSEAAKARLDGDLNRTKELYAQIAWKKTHGMGTDEELLWELKQATQGLRDTLNNTQYVGYGKEVSSALSQLDWIDSQIWMAEQELGGNVIYMEPGSASGSLALPFGAASDEERQQAVSQILDKVFGGRRTEKTAGVSAESEMGEDVSSQYKSIVESENFATLARQYNVTYNDTKRYQLLQGYVKAVEKGDISALVGFDLYERVADEAQAQLIGTTAKNGSVIENFTTHFIDRVIGQTADAHPGMRQGVKIEDVMDALLDPVEISLPKVMPDGDVRQVLKGKRASVVISIRDKRLIQTNPRG